MTESVALPSRTPPRAFNRSWLWGLAAFCLAAFLLAPAWTSVHVEGFSAQTQSLAAVLAEQGSTASHDLARPLVSQFIFLTRPGVVDLLALADRLPGLGSDLGFRMLTVLSLIALLGGSAAVAAKWSGVSFGLALLACVLTPGLVELGFYFNDNLVSAGFAALALAAALLSGGAGAAALAGLLFGVAVLCRIDALLAAPSLLLFFILRQDRLAPALARLLAMGASAVMVHLLASAWNGATLFDGWRVASLFTARHLTGHGHLPGKLALVYFFGPIVPVLAVVGACTWWKTRPAGWRRWVWLAAFYLHPLLVMAYALCTTLEIRYFLPLLGPVVALHAALGLHTLGAWLRGEDRRRRRWASGLLALALLAFAMPPALPLMRDGPRVLLGRLWSPLLWSRWQDAVNASSHTARDLAAQLARTPAATLVTTHWNDEFYLRLRLFEAGFREAPVEAACQPLSRYVWHGHVVWHVRMQPQYGLPPFSPRLAAALPLAAISRCPQWLREGADQPVWVSTFGPVREESVDNGITQGGFAGPATRVLWVTLAETPDKAQGAVLSYPLIDAHAQSAASLQALSVAAEAYVETQARAQAQTPQQLLSRYMAAFGVP